MRDCHECQGDALSGPHWNHRVLCRYYKSTTATNFNGIPYTGPHRNHRVRCCCYKSTTPRNLKGTSFQDRAGTIEYDVASTRAHHESQGWVGVDFARASKIIYYSCFNVSGHDVHLRETVYQVCARKTCETEIVSNGTITLQYLQLF